MEDDGAAELAEVERQADERWLKGSKWAQKIAAAVQRRDIRIREFLEWREKHPAAFREQIPALVRWRVLKRCGFNCSYCGWPAEATPLVIDHIRPLSKGGSNDESNLTAACWRCNLGKGATVLSDADVAAVFGESR